MGGTNAKIKQESAKRYPMDRQTYSYKRDDVI